jgi:hypothetical protein
LVLLHLTTYQVIPVNFLLSSSKLLPVVDAKISINLIFHYLQLLFVHFIYLLNIILLISEHLILHLRLVAAILKLLVEYAAFFL